MAVKKKSSKKVSNSAQKQKTNFSRLMWVLAIGVLIALVIIRTQPPTDEQLLRLAVENGMNKQSATLTYAVNEREGSYTAVYNTDYSDIANIKANGRFDLSLSEPSRQSPSISLEFVWPGDDVAYVLLRSIDDGTGTDYSEFLNRWVSVTSEDAMRFQLFDDGPHPVSSAISLGAGSLQNVVQAYGEFPDGNFSDEQIEELLEIVDNKTVYSLVSASEEKIDGKKYKKLIVNISAAGVKELNDKVADYLGDSVSPRLLNSDTEYFLFVDPTTRTIFRGGQQSQDMDDYRQDTNYNQEFDIFAPDNVESYEDFLNSLT